MNPHDLWLEEVKQRLRTDKAMAERAIAQLSDEELHRRPAPSFNSIAVIMKHVAGNLISRWTDFLTTDGEKPDRNRDGEFTEWTGTRDQLLQHWERGFKVMFDSLDALRAEDMSRTVTIRTEPHSVPKAIIRSLDHTAYHVGQILFVSRLVHSGEWKYITVAPGASAEFNRQMSRSIT
jgi:uncharacterized damage-inducible protein DinB